MWVKEKPVFTHAPAHDEMGTLEMDITVSGTKSIATRQFHQGAFKIIRPHYLDDSGQVYYIIANPGGGYVGGDAYRMDISVAAGASVLLTDQSAAKVYRTPGDYVVQNVEFNLSGDAVLEYIPDQLILYRDADFRQQITVNMDKESSLFMSDIVTPGWSPDGGKFLYKQAHLRNTIYVDGQLAVVDNVRIEPLEDLFQQVKTSFLGEHTHFSTAICIDPHMTPEILEKVRDAVRDNLEGKGPAVASVTETEVPGFVLRGVADWTEDLMRIVQAAANVVRGEIRGQGPIHLRQY